MPDHEARARVLYDREAEERSGGRRRRQVADWGVGEDVFDRLPSRRFGRTDSRRTRRRAPDRAAESNPPWLRDPAAPSLDVPRRDASGADDARAPQWDGTRAAGPKAPRWDAPAAADGDLPPAATETRLEEEKAPRPAFANGRRTIVIGGRPEGVVAPRFDRRRPPRTAIERIGARPDRIVGYAVALGLLLIILAILTAGH